jgi:class 3 adenylate cyclase
MAEVVNEHGGMVDKFQGDAVMAVFGVPVATDDHADRALRCAVAMQARQAELNTESEAAGYAPLGMGVGVNTGTVIAGTIGGGGRLEYTVMGDAVNVAQRLQSEAEGGQVLASRATVEAAPSVTATSAGSKQVKGRSEPVEVFLVSG